MSATSDSPRGPAVILASQEYYEADGTVSGEHRLLELLPAGGDPRPRYSVVFHVDDGESRDDILLWHGRDRAVAIESAAAHIGVTPLEVAETVAGVLYNDAKRGEELLS